MANANSTTQQAGPGFLSRQLYDLLTSSGPTVTSSFAQSSKGVSVADIAEQLYGHHGHAGHKEAPSDVTDKKGGLGGIMEKLHLSHPKPSGEKEAESSDTVEDAGQGGKKVHNPAEKAWSAMRPLSPTELVEIKQCGKWGAAEPSETFLNVYAQALLPLEGQPLKGLVSPSLVGSCGVIPLSIISVIPDIIQHHADLIVRAEREIFLATNYWEASSAAHTITDAFRELSRRVQARGGAKVIVKLMYDRGNPSQMISPHQSVDIKTYTGDKVKLPHPNEVPGLELEVQNYHVPPVGTFHSKYMIVDRKVAILNSNNIQDRVNVEMMTHIEGPIVQSFYDMALQSWSNPMTPPLPLLASPPTYPENPTQQHYSFGRDHPVLSGKADLADSADTARDTLAKHHAGTEQHGDEAESKWDSTNDDEAKRVDNQFSNEQLITDHLNTGTKIKGTDSSPPPNAEKFRPVVLHSPHDPVPMALVNRPPRGRPGHGDTYVPQDQAWLAGFKFAKKNVFIQTPTFNAITIVEAAIDAVRRGILVEIYADLGFNDEGELLPFQGGTNQMVSTSMYGRLSPEERKLLKIYWYTGKDQKTPLNAKDKSRNCHVKLMIVDSHIGIQGNGNQDAQSWYHSQEINVLLDSETICTEWREAIDANQNTLYYGLVDSKDGVWRDAQGKELPGVPHYPSGPMKNLVGVKGAIDRVRGEGGF